MGDLDCRTCGACCGYASPDPAQRLTLRVVDDAEAGGEVLERQRDAAGYLRCYLLRGVIGRRVACSIYRERPSVCREVAPGSRICMDARKEVGLG